MTDRVSRVFILGVDLGALEPVDREDKCMPFDTVIKPRKLAMLTTVLDQHCDSHNYCKDGVEREEAASFLLLLFSNGVQSAERLKTALEVRKRARDNPSDYQWRTEAAV
jgi:hypothetical protein